MQERTIARSTPGATISASFPVGFTWGAATAAYQIEGSPSADGKGPSIWDTFTHEPGRVANGETGDVATDHYRRWEEDVALVSALGLGAYRFSVSWPRVQPGGRGRPNPRGLDFYRRLADRLADRGVDPWVTLYHWDLPQELEDAGGWPNRDTAYRFADYAAVVQDALGDVVRHWTTLNEPWCSAFLGYASGEHAPGRQEPAAAVSSAHHLLLGHGLAVQAMRRSGPPAQLGITLNLYAVSAATDAVADRDAARRIDGLHNRLFLDPVLRGSYPQDVLDDLGGAVAPGLVRPGDLETISTPLDLLGINYYSRHTVAGEPAPDAATPGLAYPGSESVGFLAPEPVTAMGWPIAADGLTEVLRRVGEQAPGLPLYITENGACFEDEPDAAGVVHDGARTAFLRDHLLACHDAIAAGVSLRGYFVWSLLDNFEWSHGYERRFGIIRVDYPSGRRTPKDSARFYGAVARGGAV